MARETRDTSENRLYDWISDMTDKIGAERVADILGTAAVGVARTKATFDKNFDAVLALANIPSRGDYQKMQAKLDSLQGSVMSLSRTVENLREQLETAKAPRTRKKATASKSTSAKRKTSATSSANGGRTSASKSS